MSDYLPGCSIQYTKGSENVVPDALSRRPDLLNALPSSTCIDTCLPRPDGLFACTNPTIARRLQSWLTTLDPTLQIADVV